MTGPNMCRCGREWHYPFEEEDEEELGIDSEDNLHLFSTKSNRYCLDCRLAIQVCASDGDIFVHGRGQ